MALGHLNTRNLASKGIEIDNKRYKSPNLTTKFILKLNGPQIVENGKKRHSKKPRLDIYRKKRIFVAKRKGGVYVAVY